MVVPVRWCCLSNTFAVTLSREEVLLLANSHTNLVTKSQETEESEVSFEIVIKGADAEMTFMKIKNILEDMNNNKLAKSCEEKPEVKSEEKMSMTNNEAGVLLRGGGGQVKRIKEETQTAIWFGGVKGGKERFAIIYGTQGSRSRARVMMLKLLKEDRKLIIKELVPEKRKSPSKEKERKISTSMERKKKSSCGSKKRKSKSRKRNRNRSISTESCRKRISVESRKIEKRRNEFSSEK